MNYQKIYDSIVGRAKSRGLNKKLLNYYTEKHHIIPKCINGTNDVNNLALLTGREHYLCHWLLIKIHNNKKLFYAYHMLCNGAKSGRMKNKFIPKLSSKQYESMKRNLTSFFSNLHKNKIVTDECRLKMRTAKLGTHRTDETKAKISASTKGRVNYWTSKLVVSDKTKLLLSDKTEIDGIKFNSVKSAIKYATENLKISIREARRRLHSNKWPTWQIRR